MEQVIKEIKLELKEFKRQNNVNLRHISNGYQDILEYSNFFGLNRKKHRIVVRIIHQKLENTISFVYNFVYTWRNNDIDETYSIADKDIADYPGISFLDPKEVKSIYDFNVEDGIIKNRVPLETQAKTIVELFKNNYKGLVTFTKNLSNNKVAD